MRIEIKKYSVNLPNSSVRYAYIMLSGAETPTSPTYRVRLNFADREEIIGYNLEQDDHFVNVPMHFALLESVIDVLRNEKPMFFNWSTTSKIAILSTSDELIGDGDVAGSPLHAPTSASAAKTE